jgi:hypothetical protein
LPGGDVNQQGKGLLCEYPLLEEKERLILSNWLQKTARSGLRGAGRIAIRMVPAKLRKNLDDRFFYAVFNLTRVTNDHFPDSRSTASEPEEE